MKLEEMRQEVLDRGYDYSQAARITRFLQQAYQQISARYLWPFLETSVSGTEPLEVADLRKVINVLDVTSGQPLQGVSQNFLLQNFGSLDATGSPSFWWLDGDTVQTYPNSGNEIEVRYFKVPASLADTDEPLIPERWQYLIVDLAMVNCLRDDDEYEEARNLRAEVQEGVRTMVGDLMHRNLQEPRSVIRTGGIGAYL